MSHLSHLSHRDLKEFASSLEASPSASSTMGSPSRALSPLPTTISAPSTRTSGTLNAARSDGPSPAPAVTTAAGPSSTPVPTTTLVGAVIGAVAGLCLLVVVGWLLVRRRRKQRVHGEILVDPPPYIARSEVKSCPCKSSIPWELDASHRDCVYELDDTSLRYK